MSKSSTRIQIPCCGGRGGFSICVSNFPRSATVVSMHCHLRTRRSSPSSVKPTPRLCSSSPTSRGYHNSPSWTCRNIAAKLQRSCLVAPRFPRLVMNRTDCHSVRTVSSGSALGAGKLLPRNKTKNCRRFTSATISTNCSKVAVAKHWVRRWSPICVGSAGLLANRGRFNS